ncbi:adenylate/guanylate cyclase domain-containing protein [Arthrobacter sp. DNA4]|uniref:adenylate/guanylate cyclase domain-containing protein n=1 Tax=Arthrobacter sp. DNA4 TaxID=2963432 RepID=UPI0020CDE707|nr:MULTISPECIES: adenylate/guanylate cyclase domain-containing protein [Micrococcaceae]UTT70813.1 adenylate/guanylate cyclase domain-containing protein [Arthrobacter sp. DNA4]WRT15240.1 adenylate/guanylate cyclase domain-containing protein [Pseudarthrobacter sp. LT1]
MTDEAQQERVERIPTGTAAVEPASDDYHAGASLAGPDSPAEMPAVDRHPPTGAMSAERLAMKALEARLLGGERKLRRREVAAGAGLSLLSARKLWRALGFPNFGDEDVAFTERDQAALSTVVDLVRAGKLTEEAAISVTRSIGQMTDRMVVWQIEALVEDMVHEQGVTDAVARKRLVNELPALVDALEEVLVYSWRRQLNAGVQRLAVRAEAGLQASEEGREGDEDDAPLPLARAVGFADLVSYTSLSRRMNEKTLARLVQRFENKCAEIISVGGGRLVKTVGDEVLYIAETPAAGAEISLALAEAFTEDEILPEARVAMVWGRILSRLGDIYGPTVNLAARLTTLADPGTVLVDSMTASALEHDERFVLIPQEPENVRGFGEINPVRLTRGRGKGLVLD